MKKDILMVIDPFTRSTKTVEVESGTAIEAARGIIGCQYVEALQIHEKITILIDENGMLGDLDEQAFFGIIGFDCPLAGRAVLIAERGKPPPTVEWAVELANSIRFPDNSTARIMIAREYLNREREAERRRAEGFNVFTIGPSPRSVLPEHLHEAFDFLVANWDQQSAERKPMKGLNALDRVVWGDILEDLKVRKW